MTICLGDLVLSTLAEATTLPLVGSKEDSLELEDPGAGLIVAGVHVCSRCNRAASCNNNVDMKLHRSRLRPSRKRDKMPKRIRLPEAARRVSSALAES